MTHNKFAKFATFAVLTTRDAFSTRPLQRRYTQLSNFIFMIFSLLILQMLTSNPSMAQAQQSSNLELNDKWFGVEYEQQGMPVIVRGRRYLKNFVDSNQYNVSVEITWLAEISTESGIPSPEENLFMQEVEEKLVNELEVDLQSIITLVFITNNEKSMIFYTKSEQEFFQRFNKVLSNYKRLNITLERSEDSDWELYSGILSNYGLVPE